MNLKYLLILILAVLIASISQLLLKIASGKKYSRFIYQYLNIKVITAYSLFILSSLLTIVAYRKIMLKYGPIIQSSSYIFILVFSHIFLKEKISSNKIIGIILIIVGISVFSYW